MCKDMPARLSLCLGFGNDAVNKIESLVQAGQDLQDVDEDVYDIEVKNDGSQYVVILVDLVLAVLSSDNVLSIKDQVEAKKEYSNAANYKVECRPEEHAYECEGYEYTAKHG